MLVAPAAVRIVELDGAVTDLWLPRARSAESYRSLLAIGRREGLPIASAVVPVERDGWVSGDQLAFALRGRLEGHIEADAGRRAAPEAPMAVSVVVTTCSEPVVLARCLRSILACDHDDFEVIVVENRPHSRDTRRMLLEKFPDDPQLRYIEEEAPGLSSARNAGLEAATGDVVAFTDDDVVVDPSWIRRAAEAFAGCEEVACVTGLILPLDLETESQVLVEQFMALGKGFRRRTFRLPDARDTHPLLPYTAGVIGSGANTVVRADVARRIGGFDTTLGTGTPAAGGEDLDLYIRLLRKGHAVTYEPAAIVWHTHPDGTAELRRQVYKYGVALGATLTKQLVTGPDRGELLRAVPAGIRYARDSGSRKNTGKAASYPRHLDWLERIGMVAGPFAYLMSALSARSRKASRPPARASFNGNAPVEALVLASGQALPVVDAGSQTHDAGVRRRVVTAAAIAACLIAPLLVALDAPPGLRFAAVLAFLGLTPGTALMSALRGRPELGLVVGASLATIAVLAQSMLWLGMWEPRVLLYCAAAACLPPLAARLDLPRRTPRHAMGRIAPSALAHGLLLSAAMAAWVASIEGTDLSRIAGLGLLDALPPAYFLAFAMLIAGFVVAVTRDDLQPWLLALYVLALVAVLHGTTPLLYEEPRYPWVYKHLAVIDLIAEGDGVDRQTDIYANWPGFFAANAWLSTVGGISARAYAEWAQVFFNLVNVAALLFALRGVTGNQRLLWTSAWLFVLANWVGQDYLAPQAFGFCLSLVVFGLALRCTPLPLPPRSRVGRWWASRLQRLRSRFFHRSTIADPLPPAPMSPTPALVVGAVLYVAIVVSHQLTPVITIAGVAGLAVFSRRVPIWVPIAMVVVEIWWLACSWSYFSEHFVLFHIDPGASGAPPGYSLGAGLPGLELVGYASRVLVLLVVGLAAVGVASRLRASRHDLASAVLVVAPAIVIALQAYSGEGRYRLFLFALPWLCFFAAVACVPPRSWQLREPLRGWRLTLAGGAIGACLLPAYFGLELTNRVTHGDVAAAVWFNDHAPPDSLAVEVTENALTRLNGGYAHVIDRRFSTSPTLTNEASYRDRGLGQKDLPRIAGGLRGYAAKHTFLLLTPNQERFARLYGILPEGWRQSLERALERSRAFTRVYRNDGASIFRYEPPVSRRREVSLVWADDFDGPAGAPPDPAKWSFETGGNWQGELQAYTRDNASLDGKGHLAISARREQYTGEDGVTSAYTSARLNTRRKLVFAYGRVIARIRIPAGRGLHPAFWALGSNYGSVGWPASGEIDVMEFDSLDPRLLAGTLHGPDHTADGYFLRAYRRLPGSAARRFHEYGMTWSPGRIVFTIDGRRYGSFERGDQPRRSPWSYDHPFFLVFTLAIRAGETGGPDASTRWPATMLVDWVRVRHGRATYCPAVRAPALRGSCPRRPPPATSEAGR